MAATMATAGSKIQSDFMELLRSRRCSAEVLLMVEQGELVAEPLYQPSIAPGSRQVMESCLREDIEDFKDRLVEENLYSITEAGEQGHLPMLILSMKGTQQQRRSTVVFLHSSYKCKEWLRPLFEAYASRGYISVAIDSRCHVEKAKSATTYKDALVSAWKNVIKVMHSNKGSPSPKRHGSLSVAAEVFELSQSLYVVELQKLYGDSMLYREIGCSRLLSAGAELN